MSEQIVSKIKYLVEKSKYFQQLKENESYLFQEINNLDENILIDIQRKYTDTEKINKIRYETAKFLQKNILDSIKFKKLKQNINNEYETNILKAWKKNYSILYIFFFNEIKQKVNNMLSEIAEYFISSVGIEFKLKISNFDGGQNFGEAGCWLALYNPKYKSQSDGIQYFINFYSKNLTYGIYKHSTKEHLKRKYYTYEDINNILLEKIVDDIKKNTDIILEIQNLEKGKNDMKNLQPLNQILYGPPGTGKTYNTIDKALEIILEKESNEEIEEILKKDEQTKDERKKLKDAFEEYKKTGQIEFVTFHQSYGYEEFVEGIKADVESENIKYKLESGIFKKLSKKSEENYVDSKKSKVQIKAEYSLKQKLNNFLSNSLEEETVFKKTKGGEFKIKDINESVISLFSKDSNYNENVLKLDFDELYQILDSSIDIKTSRQIAKDVFGISNQRQKDTYYFAIYKRFKQFSDDGNETIEVYEQSLKNYILIIDEINRGNISKIFGELITLVEPSKRIGENEEIKLKLSNSKELFGVPNNLYIIGTMNTADRSIAQIDTALRRRFKFIDMMPQHKLLNNSKIEDTNINIQKILEAINEKIEYIYDREHTIGHSYFMPLLEEPTKQKLDEIFRVNIIPLLAEYFYGDWEDIRFVLNNDFIKEKPKPKYTQNHTRALNKVYVINDEFRVDEYLKIYNDLEQKNND